jgi:hypothetical protein
MADRAIIGVFVHAGSLVAAVRAAVREGFRPETVFSPIPLPEIKEITGARTSIVRAIVLGGAVAGGLSLIAMAVYAHLSFSLITGGKPILPWIAWVIVCFEGIILGGVTSAVVAWVLTAGLPRLRHPRGYEGTFSRDRFGALVVCPPEKVESVRKLFLEEGAEEVRDVD